MKEPKLVGADFVYLEILARDFEQRKSADYICFNEDT